jgi:hypothetical protein
VFATVFFFRFFFQIRMARAWLGAVWVGACVLSAQARYILSPLVDGVFHLRDDEGPQTLGISLESPPSETITVQLDGPNRLLFDTCELVFTQENWNTTQYVHLRGLTVHTVNLKFLQHNYELKLRSVGLSQGLSDEYRLPLSREIQTGARCFSWGDPHLGTFDGRKYNLQLTGPFYLLKAPEWVVQVEHTPCNRRVSCMSAVAIMYKNNAVILSINTEANVVSALYNAHLDESEMFIAETHNSRTFTISLDNGGRIRLDTRNWNRGRHANVWIDVPSIYYKNTLGLCGLYDDKVQNDFTLRGDSAGLAKSINGFGASWQVPESENLFLLCQSEDNCVLDDVRRQTVDKFTKHAESTCRFQTETMVTQISTLGFTPHGFRPLAGFRMLDYSTSHQFISAQDSNKVFSEFQINDQYKSTVETYCNQVLSEPSCSQVLPFDFIQTLQKDCLTDTLNTGLLDGIEDARQMFVSECYAALSAQVDSLDTEDERVHLEETLRSLGLGAANCSAVNDCSEQGDCTDFGCQCNEGFTGFHCELNLEDIPQPGKIVTTDLPSHASPTYPGLLLLALSGVAYIWATLV